MQFAWGPDFSSPAEPTEKASFVSISDCRRVHSPTGPLVWEYKAISQTGIESVWLPEARLLQTFTRLQLDGFIALWHLYNPELVSQLTPRTQPRAPLSVREALRIYPLGFTFQKDFGGGLKLQGQVFGYRDRYWRVRYSNQNWEEMTRQELERCLH